MWPTFFIPAVAPGAPTPVNYDCWFQFTRYSDLTRGYSDGIIADPVLQFETEPNTAYWIFGYVKFGTVYRAGGPVVLLAAAHSGDTDAFFWRGGHVPFSTDGEVSSHEFEVANALGNIGSARDDANLSEIIFPHTATFLVDAFLKTGSAGGAFSLNWGISNDVLGQIKINTGSTIVVRKPVEVI